MGLSGVVSLAIPWLLVFQQHAQEHVRVPMFTTNPPSGVWRHLPLEMLLVSAPKLQLSLLQFGNLQIHFLRITFTYALFEYTVQPQLSEL